MISCNCIDNKWHRFVVVEFVFNVVDFLGGTLSTCMQVQVSAYVVARARGHTLLALRRLVIQQICVQITYIFIILSLNPPLILTYLDNRPTH